MLLIRGNPALCSCYAQRENIIAEIFYIVIDIQIHGAICPFFLCAACLEEGFLIFCHFLFCLRFIVSGQLLDACIYLCGQLLTIGALHNGDVYIQLHIALCAFKGTEGQHLRQLPHNGNLAHVFRKNGACVQPDGACDQNGCCRRNTASPDGAIGFLCFGCFLIFIAFVFHFQFLLIFGCNRLHDRFV